MISTIVCRAALLVLTVAITGAGSLGAQSEAVEPATTRARDVPAARVGRLSLKPSVKYNKKSNTSYTWMTWEWVIPVPNGSRIQLGEPIQVTTTVFSQFAGKTLLSEPDELFIRLDVVRSAGAEPIGKQHRRSTKGGVVRMMIDSVLAVSYPVQGVEADSRFVFLEAVVKAPRTRQYILALPIAEVRRLATAENSVQGEVAGQYFEWNRSEINNLRILLESLQPQ